MYRLTCVTDNAKIRILLSLALATTRLSHRTEVARISPAASCGLAPPSSELRRAELRDTPHGDFLHYFWSVIILLSANYYITFRRFLYYFSPSPLFLSSESPIPRPRPTSPAARRGQRQDLPPYRRGRRRRVSEALRRQSRDSWWEAAERLGTSSEICTFGML